MSDHYPGLELSASLGELADLPVDCLAPALQEFVQRIGGGGEFTADELAHFARQAEQMVAEQVGAAERHA